MGATKMHPDEIETDVALVFRLLAAQFPQWADLSIDPVATYGTDHDIYRLGDHLAARLPRIAWATKQAVKEAAAEARAAPAARASGAAGDGASGRGLSLRLVRVSVVARRER